MFGLLKGNRLCSLEKGVWTAHLCGLCLALKKTHGHLSRLAINTDSVLLSLLCEAQSPKRFQRIRHYCPLHRFRAVTTVEPSNIASQYAGMVSVLIGASKIADHIADQDTWIRHFPKFFSNIASHWYATARKISKRIGFDTREVETQISYQFSLEQMPDKDFLFYSQAIENATGVLCKHTAMISGHPENSEPLYHIGRMFGRIIYLLDSYQDYLNDIAHSRFNALAQSYPKDEIQIQAKKLFFNAHEKLKWHLSQLKLFSPVLISKLLINQLEEIATPVLKSSPGILLLANNKKDKSKGCLSICDCCDCFSCGSVDCGGDGGADCCDCSGCDCGCDC